MKRIITMITGIILLAVIVLLIVAHIKIVDEAKEIEEKTGLPAMHMTIITR